MFSNSLINKRINLDANDGLSAYEGHAAQQHHDAFGVMYGFFNKVKPKNILEIGTALGGFTRVMYNFSKHFTPKSTMLSYDIYYKPWYDDMVRDGMDIRVENVFDKDFISVKQEVIDYIQRVGVTIVFCDGGWKKGELNLLSNFIKPGDFILAHDYCDNKQVFEEKIKGKVWNWFEISFNDIKESCERNGLIEYDKEIFNNVAWTCRQKL